jgi:hypothetical protein
MNNLPGTASICLDGQFAETVSQNAIDLRLLTSTSRIAIVDSRPDNPCAVFASSPSEAPAQVPKGSTAVTATDFTGEWRGSYSCNQGETGLTLIITPSANGSTVSAKFDFYPVPSNPGVPSGSFTMSGSYASGELRLTQENWINQPGGYGMVDLVLNTAPGDDNTLTGTVIGHIPGCDWVSLKRRST